MRDERQILFWMALGLVFLVAVLTLQDVLLPFVAGVVLAYAFNPLADVLGRAGLPRWAAAALVVGAFAAIVATLFVFLVPLLIAQLQQLLATLPGELERSRTLLETWGRENLGSQYPAFEGSIDQALDEITRNGAAIAQYVAGSLWSQGRAVVGFLSLLLITPVVFFYVLVDWNAVVRQIDSWLPRVHAATLRRLASDIDQAIAAFIRGQGLVCLILGTYYSIALSAAGLKYGLLIGIVTGVLSFVPFVGWALGLITSVTLALIQGWPDTTLVLLVLAVFAGSQALDAAVLSPMIVGSRIGLHPVWLIFALVVFSYLFGTVGVLVAVPLAAATGVLVRFALKVYLESSFYGGTPGSNPRSGGAEQHETRPQPAETQP